jgi:inhibitor of cysteine peptidase
MLNNKLIFFLLLSIFLIPQYAFSADQNDFNTPDKTIMVGKNSPIFTIKLKSNPTTGYQWFLTQYDNNLIEPISHNYYAPDSKLVGAGGYEIWTFKVKNAGFAVPQVINVQMAYTRSWNLENYQPTNFKVVTHAD